MEKAEYQRVHVIPFPLNHYRHPNNVAFTPVILDEASTELADMIRGPGHGIKSRSAGFSGASRTSTGELDLVIMNRGAAA